MDITKTGGHNPYAIKIKLNDKAATGPYHNRGGQVNSARETAPDSTSNQETDNISIGSEALQRYMQEKHGVNYKLTPQLDLSSFRIPEKGALKELAGTQEKKELPVMKNFLEGSVEQFIFNAFDGKAENAYELASRLGGMVYSTESGTDAGTKAADREAGKKLAEYIAQNYLDDPEESKSFLDGINKFAGLAEMRDKGYTVIIGSNVGPFKPKFNDFARYAEEEFGYSGEDLNDREKISEVLKSFTAEAINQAQKYSKNSNYSVKTLPTLLNNDSMPYMFKEEKEEFNRAFDENEKLVQGIIDKMKEAMSKVTIDDDFLANFNWILK